VDDIVKQAMEKWPNVPHCYHWLALDGRGAWRMRDERTQALNLPGDKLVRGPLIDFINRNYTCDDRGRWYFQNGPQRVYVDLDSTPYIARTDPESGFLLHTGTPFQPDSAWITENGRLVLESGGVPAMVDDRDTAEWLPNVRSGGKSVRDDVFLSLLETASGGTPFDGTLLIRDAELPLHFIPADRLADRFRYVPRPEP
jgi:hypothetical protein